ncbi:hypothetical protein BATDEDRAFT_86597 [Batrachochytrium dendrobatidis JAM81]|uniref:F-box domain-containing protein n=2 Tax=Batrachochytrium dendrobatidis TaxID=109871 RepID=F4NXJ5_BATDJ|nr:uncharacterized protein BATDEDRAFT_86597 [Batrachochytrium dendrobatidis JAM81]EGF82358.1 hypothetical protein BATDEDRAFT_86597 [Batrachochytrium dendrobatidis JAM81]OAJ39857.1 hypothetical protein BDEG_23661 [Batrachochytrium dendrobatidis JEL423]|eukprot:XP_006676894.1 hypothetical protein BATDEDRAFT_86597 [Batrachochytrium dendrobatidis JAM81]
MNSLPLELKLLFIKFLEPREISRLARTCRNNYEAISSCVCWETVFEARFDKCELPEDRLSSKSVYQQLHKHSVRLGPRNLTICWMNDPHYWETVVEPNSTFGEVAQLHSVCWLDIAGNFKGVPRGEYYPVIRFQTGEYIGFLDRANITFKVVLGHTEQPPTHVPVESTKKFNVVKDIDHWQDFVMDPIHVGTWPNADAYYSISCTISGHDRSWKNKFKIDSIYLHDVKKGLESLHVFQPEPEVVSDNEEAEPHEDTLDPTVHVPRLMIRGRPMQR